MGRILVGLGVLVLVAACGGGAGSAPPAPDGGGGSAASPASGGEAATEPPAADPSAEATAPPAEPPGEGGGASDACGLATVADVEAVFGVSPVTQQLVEGFPATCDFQLDGAPFAAIVLVDDATSAGTIYDAWAADAGAVDVSGLGDRAVYAPSNAILVIQRGDRVASIAYFDDGSQSQDERVELLRQLGQVVAGRL